MAIASRLFFIVFILIAWLLISLIRRDRLQIIISGILVALVIILAFIAIILFIGRL
ncbi:hypothetical protein [uncultured Secundilactobacillus sp.]|uniref:hypothetical protein n=1 Tax=uncultured Secundilactobacillus sp. TaxID=2813935 RepID=UPI0025848E75|nr:hypothetical protein [uncultured Secundilactobacillus sp.]